MTARFRTALASLTIRYRSLALLGDRRIAVLALGNALDAGSETLLIPLLPLYADRLGIDPVLLGVLFALPTGVEAVLSGPFGSVADRRGRRPLIVGGMAVGAASLLGIGLVVDPAVAPPVVSLPVALVVLRGLDGFGAAVRGPATSAYLGDVTRPEERGRVMGLVGTFGTFGTAVAPAVGGVLAVGGSLGLPFLVFGAATVGGTALLLLFLPAAGNDGNDETTATTDDRSLLAGIRTLGKHDSRSVLALLASSFLLTLALGAQGPFFAPLLGRTVDAGPAYMGLFWSSFNVAIVASMPLGGWLVDRVGRKPAVVAGEGSWVIVAFALPVVTAPALPLALYVLEGLGVGLQGPARNALQYETAPDGVEGTAVGVYSAATAAGATIGPLLAGGLASVVGLRAVFYCVGTLLLVQLLFVAFGVRTDD